MKNFQALSAILHGAWLIDKQWAENHLPIVASMLEGKSIQLPGRYAYDDDQESERASENKGKVYCISAGTFTASPYRNFNEAPEGSIALISMEGPILKHDDGCGGVGSMTIARMVQEMNDSSKIIGAILISDTPGGSVSGTPTAGDAIFNSKKPIVTFIEDGMMASAGYWMGSGAREVIASQPTDTIGSIGVYTTIADFKGFYELKGIKTKDIYSDYSKDKNKTYKDALEGKEDGIKEDLNHIAEQFHAVVKRNRGEKLNAKEVLTGKMYKAADAKKHGLIDEIGTFSYAIQRVQALANQSQSNNNSNDTNMKFSFKSTMTALLSLFSLSVAAGQDSVEKEISSADWEKINAELAEKNTLAQKVKDLEAAAAKVATTHQDEIKSLGSQLTSMTTERDSWKQKAEEYGAKGGAESTSAVKEKTDAIDDGKKEIAGYNPEADHNVEARKMLGLK